jgi:hypothetical protein
MNQFSPVSKNESILSEQIDEREMVNYLSTDGMESK